MPADPPELSVVIPVYNRGRLVAHTLRSVAAASVGLRVETIIVDDGSATPVAEDLAALGLQVDKLIRQENRGLLFARLAGLAAATGRLVLFLDSDDSVSTDKLRLHVEAMRDGAWDVTYTDTAHVTLGADGGPCAEPTPGPPQRDASGGPDFFLCLQPAPHSPVFDTAFLRRAIAATAYPPRAAFNPVAEIWFYHKASVLPVRVRRIPGALAIVGQHGHGRLTDHWERLGLASLSVMEHFLADTPPGPHAAEARARVSANAFAAWRRHPHGMPLAIQRRYLRAWRRARDPRLLPEGGPFFLRLSRLLGALPAAWILRRLRNPSYKRIRTLDRGALAALLAANPPPPETAHTPSR